MGVVMCEMFVNESIANLLYVQPFEYNSRSAVKMIWGGKLINALDCLDAQIYMSCTQLVAFKAFPTCDHASKPYKILNIGGVPI